jgi:toxin ParE1/3/4
MRLVWTARARLQLLHIVDTIAADNPNTAWSLHDYIEARAQSLLDFPELGPPSRVAGTRQLVITGTLYLLTYRVKEDRITIANVWHGRQSRR